MIGLDLSLRRPAAVIVPKDWAGDWASTIWTSVYRPGAVHKGDAEGSVRRLAGLRDWVRSLPLERGPAFIERPAYGGSFVAHTLGEGLGVVKLALLDGKCQFSEVAANEARKLLLGKCPVGRDLIKAVMMSAWRSLGFPWPDDEDLCDAMTVLNFGLYSSGGFFFAATLGSR